MQTAAIAQVYSKNITEISAQFSQLKYAKLQFYLNACESWLLTLAQFSQLKYAKLQFYLNACESWLLTLKAEHEVIINILSKICTL